MKVIDLQAGFLGDVNCLQIAEMFRNSVAFEHLCIIELTVTLWWRFQNQSLRIKAPM